MTVAINELTALLGKSENDTSHLRSQLGEPEISGSAHYRFHEFRKQGISLAFKSPLGTEAAGNPDCRLVAIHLYAAGQEGYEQYGGALPFGVQFGKHIDDVRLKIANATYGAPKKVAGIGMSREWLKSALDDSSTVRFEFDNHSRRVVLATFESV